VLRRLEVSNFKCFGDKQSIEIAPITLITGTNSSGKSTLTQAIRALSLTHAVRAKDPCLEVALGELALGSYQDVVFKGEVSRPIVLSIECSGATLTLEAHYEFGDNKNRPILTRARFLGESWPKTLPEEYQTTDATIDTPPARIFQSPCGRNFLFEGLLPAREVIPGGSLTRDERDLVQLAFEQQLRDVLVTTARHDIVAESRRDKKYYRAALRLIDEGTSAFAIAQQLFEIDSIAPDLEQPSETEGRGEFAAFVAAAGLSAEQERLLRQVSRLADIDSLIANLGAEIDRVKISTPKTEALDPNRILDKAFEMALSVTYIGPLRAEPDVIYADRAIKSVSEIGSSGEYVAALLRRRWHETVHFPVIADDLSVSRRSASLGDAINWWLEYLELEQILAITEIPPYGLSFSLSQRKWQSRASHVGNVGVGFSQVLPILVAGLTRDTSMAIIEQPELHLHPALQTRLGYFLAAASSQENAFVVETHSEHIVNAFRLLVAYGAFASSEVGLNFIERTHEGSSLKPIQMRSDGKLSRWPSGFFDESERRLLQLARANRRSQ
jgi:predicted ATPase